MYRILINKQAESNLLTAGKALSCMERQSSEIDTPIRPQFQRNSNYSNVQHDSEGLSSQKSRSPCLLADFTEVSDSRELESQHNSQPPEPLDYGTQPDEWRDEFEDYDWDEDRKIKHRIGKKTKI